MNTSSEKVEAPALETTEQAVIGAMLIESRCVGDVVTTVSADDFIHASYRRLFEVARDLYNEGAPVDIVTIIDRAGGSLKQLAITCMDTTPTAVNVLKYAEILHQQATFYRLQVAALAVSTADNLEEATDLLAQAAAIVNGRPGVKVYSITELAADFMTRLGSPAPPYIQWGLGMLDANLHTAAGHYVILGARPSTGKTALGLQTGLNIAKQKRVGFISLETGHETAGDRIAASNLPITLPDIKRRQVDIKGLQRIAESPALADMTTRNFDFVEASSMTVQEIKSLALARRYEVVIIDYVQLIRPTVRGDRQEQMQDVSIQLRAMAQLTGITIIALAQLRRPSSESKNAAATMADLKESGQFEQDADTVLLMYLVNPNDRAGDRWIKIDKNKDGHAGLKSRFSFDGKKQLFTPVKADGSSLDGGPVFTELDDEETQYELSFKD
nr:replicative DNA helicase [uncultured Dysosmobacter sp.]